VRNQEIEDGVEVEFSDDESPLEIEAIDAMFAKEDDFQEFGKKELSRWKRRLKTISKRKEIVGTDVRNVANVINNEESEKAGFYCED